MEQSYGSNEKWIKEKTGKGMKTEWITDIKE